MFYIFLLLLTTEKNQILKSFIVLNWKEMSKKSYINHAGVFESKHWWKHLTISLQLEKKEEDYFTSSVSSGQMDF